MFKRKPPGVLDTLQIIYETGRLDNQIDKMHTPKCRHNIVCSNKMSHNGPKTLLILMIDSCGRNTLLPQEKMS